MRRKQRRTLQVATGSIWSPVLISTAFAFIPRIDMVLILRYKALREKLGIDVMLSLNGKTQGGTEDVGSRGGWSLRDVTGTMKDMQAAGKMATAVAPRNYIVQDAVALGPAFLWRLAMRQSPVGKR